MSGTSLDGVDIALCEIDTQTCNLLHYKEYPYDKVLKEQVLHALNKPLTLEEFGSLNVALGEMFAKHTNSFLDEHTIVADSIEAIGLHGQTLWHSPHTEHPFSLQFGSASVVVARTQIPTVSDFRNLDIAYGGEGAPFAPAFHHFLYANEPSTALLNIGGMANISVLGENLQGWDTGCGNVLLDYWMQQTQLKPYDKDGEFAQSGKILERLLEKMLSDVYFAKEPPKSTGREYFTPEWLEQHLQEFQQEKAQDVQRTLVELTAQSIANDLKKAEIKKLIVCGGGAKNSFLLKRLKELSQTELSVEPNADALEAMAFAWFAYKRLKKEPLMLSSVTGANKNTLQGAIYG